MDTVQWSKSVLLDSSEPPQEEQGEVWLTHGGAMTFLAKWKEKQGELWLTQISIPIPITTSISHWIIALTTTMQATKAPTQTTYLWHAFLICVTLSFYAQLSTNSWINQHLTTIPLFCSIRANAPCDRFICQRPKIGLEVNATVGNK